MVLVLVLSVFVLFGGGAFPVLARSSSSFLLVVILLPFTRSSSSGLHGHDHNHNHNHERYSVSVSGTGIEQCDACKHWLRGGGRSRLGVGSWAVELLQGPFRTQSLRIARQSKRNDKGGKKPGYPLHATIRWRVDLSRYTGDDWDDEPVDW